MLQCSRSAGDIVVVCCQGEGSHTSPPHHSVQYKVARQKLSLSVIIGSWCAIIDIPAAVEYPTRRLAHDTNIYNNIFASDHPAARSMENLPGSARLLSLLLIVVYRVGLSVNIVIMSLVLCVEIVRSGDIIHN